MNELTNLDIPSTEIVQQALTSINTFKNIVHQNLIEGVDYGTIAGVNKPTLLKAGAEKVAKILGFTDNVTILDEVKDWEKGFFFFTCKVQLLNTHGLVVSEGIGHCNSKEDKYAWRWVYESDLPYEYRGEDNREKRHQDLVYKEISYTTKDGNKATTKKYRVRNDAIFDQVNTILKMAEKRAFIDAVLKASRLSECFTQDVEDMATGINTEEPIRKTQAEQPKKTTSTTTKKTASSETKYNCQNCGKYISQQSYQFSTTKYKMALCYDCQEPFKNGKTAIEEAKAKAKAETKPEAQNAETDPIQQAFDSQDEADIIAQTYNYLGNGEA